MGGDDQWLWRSRLRGFGDDGDDAAAVSENVKEGEDGNERGVSSVAT